MHLNAFQTVRPRGADTGVVAKPIVRNQSKATLVGNVHMALDAKGRPTVSLEPRRVGAITIENREQRLSSEAKQARIAGGVR